MYGLDELPPCDVEPNVFYEPRPAVAPYFVVPCAAEYDCQIGDPYNDRAEAEIEARLCAEATGKAFHVVGCVSISSVPKPLPVKASTRALV